jgi:hypothetical protein
MSFPFTELTHGDDALYVVARFGEFVGQRSRDVLVKQKRHPHELRVRQILGTGDDVRIVCCGVVELSAALLDGPHLFWVIVIVRQRVVDLRGSEVEPIRNRLCVEPSLFHQCVDVAHGDSSVPNVRLVVDSRLVTCDDGVHLPRHIDSYRRIGL